VGDGALIGNDRDDKGYRIEADEIVIGEDVVIEDGVVISGIYDIPCKRVEIGDNSFIGRNTLILVPEFSLGDYCTIHKASRISGYKRCSIGHNFWMDQNCVLNCADELRIGNGVGVGAYSQLWTHIKFGDLLEGCRYNSTKPMMIDDDVWFVGHCMVSPIHAGNKSVAMLGSVVTKDMEPNHVYGGCPAVDLTPKIGAPFMDTSVDEKLEMMHEQKKRFFEESDYDQGRIEVVTDFPADMETDITYYNVSTRTYSKRLSDVEIAFMKFLLPLYKFTPETGG